MEGLKCLCCEGTTPLPTFLPKYNKRYSIFDPVFAVLNNHAPRAWQQHVLYLTCTVMFPELSGVGVPRFHTMHIAFRGSSKRFSAKVPTIACAQRQSDKRKVHVVKNLSWNASGKNGSRLSISNSFLHDHDLRKLYRIELFVRHSEASCCKTGIVVN